VSELHERRAAGDLYAQLNVAVDRMPVRRAHWLVFALVAIGGLFNAIEQYNVGYAGPAIAADFGLSQTQVGLLSTGTFVAMALGSLLSGLAGDRLGRKPVFLANIAIFTFGAALTALAPNYELLLLGRVLIGIGLGGEISLGYTVVAELMPSRRRGAMTAAVQFIAGGVGVFAASGLAALFFGPLAGVLGGPDTAWRWFLGLMVLPAVLLVVARRYIPETPRYLLQRGRIAQTNRVLSLLAADRLRDDPTVPTTDHVVGTEGVGADRGTGGARVVELLAPGVRSRAIVGWLLTFGLFGAAVTLTIFMPTVLVGRGLAIGESLAYTMITTFGGLLGSLAGVVAAARAKRRWTLAIGSVVCAVCAAGLFLSPSLGLALTSAAIMQFTFAGLISVNAAYLTELFPTRLRALGSGSAFTVGLLAAGLGPLAAGAVLDSLGNVGMCLAVATICLIVLVAALSAPETHGKPLDPVGDLR
jgi:MFS family permease